MNINDQVDEVKPPKVYKASSVIHLKPVATGTYGQCIFGRVKEDNMNVVVKRNTVPKETKFVASLKELSILLKFGEHPFIVNLAGISFCNPFNTTLPHLKEKYLRTDSLYFLFPQAAYDGHTFIYGKPRPSFTFIKAAMVQILLGVEYLHSKGVIHRDIKPANLLWFRNEDDRCMRICDFGLSLYYTKQRRNSYEVVTPAYRAPEIFLRTNHDTYTSKSDMWSVGCVLFEMVAAKPFLYTRTDSPCKLAEAVMALVPYPPTTEAFHKLNYARLSVSSRCRTFKRNLLRQLRMTPQDISLFNNASVGGNVNQFLHLLERLLTVDPDHRYSAREALDHPFFDNCKDYIQLCRNEYPPIPDPPPMVKTVPKSDTDRTEGLKLAQLIWKNRDQDQVASWYEDRMLFLALDIFDRCLINRSSADDTDIDQSIDMPKRAHLKFLSCLYIAIKASSGMMCPPSFEEVVIEEYASKDSLLYVERFEMQVLEILKYNVNRNTLFETADLFDIDILSEDDIKDLLDFYTNLDEVYMSTVDLFMRFRPNATLLSNNENKPTYRPLPKFRPHHRRVANTSSKVQKTKLLDKDDESIIINKDEIGPGAFTVAPKGEVLTVRTRKR